MSQFDFTNQLHDFRENGFAIFPRLHSSEFYENWRILADQLTSGKGKSVSGNLIEIAPHLAILAIANPTLLDFAEKVMGPFVQLDGLTLVTWPPLSTSEESGDNLHWHRDPWSQVPRSNEYDRPLAINALTYLQDLNDCIGPLRLIPKSHRTPLTIPTNLRDHPHPDEALINLKRGDVIVMHNNLVHSRSPNRSAFARSYISVYYNLSWLKPSSSYDGPEARKILRIAEQYNDRRLMRLFGIDSELEARTNSGFLSNNEECWDDWIREDRAALNV